GVRHPRAHGRASCHERAWGAQPVRRMNAPSQHERVLVADLNDPAHGAAVLTLLNAYAQDIMGGGEDLSAFAKANLVPALRARADALAILAFVGDEPAGLAVCIEGFSTFACKPLLNIHDMVVAPPFRGRGL